MIERKKKRKKKKGNNHVVAADAVRSGIYPSHLRPLMIICLLLEVIPPTFEML